MLVDYTSRQYAGGRRAEFSLSLEIGLADPAPHWPNQRASATPPSTSCAGGQCVRAHEIAHRVFAVCAYRPARVRVGVSDPFPAAMLIPKLKYDDPEGYNLHSSTVTSKSCCCFGISVARALVPAAAQAVGCCAWVARAAQQET